MPNGTPHVDIGADTTIFEGQHLTRTASFTDPDFGPWTVTIDYGDGTLPLQFGTATNASFPLDHIYEAGQFDVAVTVADGLHATETKRFHLTVANIPPQVFVDVPSAYLDTITHVRGTFSDPGTRETFTGTIDFGDETPTEDLRITDRAFDAVHRYTRIGNFAVHIRIRDSNGEVGEGPAVGAFVRRRPLVFIPGFGGTMLRATRSGFIPPIENGHGGTVSPFLLAGEEVWPNYAKEALNDDYFDILKFRENGTPYVDQYEARELLTEPHVTGTYWQVEPFLTAAGYTRADYRIFTYDWRYSAESNVAHLDQTISALLQEAAAYRAYFRRADLSTFFERA